MPSWSNIPGVQKVKGNFIYSDLFTITNKYSITSSDIATYFESLIITSTALLSSGEVYSPASGGTDSATIESDTTVIPNDVFSTSDSSIIVSNTNLTAIEITSYIETSIITSITSPASTEVNVLQDSATINGITIPSATESQTHTFADSNIIPTTTSLVAVDIKTHDYADSATPTSTTTLTYVEVTAYVETTSLVTSTTSLFSTETTEFVDETAVGFTTMVFSSEISSAGQIDQTTITHTTTLDSIETYDFVSVDFIATAVYRRWNITQTFDGPHWTVRFYRRWDAVSSLKQLTGTASRKWAAWKP